MIIPKGHSSEQGFSLVGVLISLGVIGIVSYLFFGGNASDMKANKNLELHDQITNLALSVADEAYFIAQLFKAGECLPEEDIRKRSLSFGTGASDIRLKTQLNFSGTVLTPELSSVAARCKKLNLIAATNVNNSSRSHLYFCLASDAASSKSPPQVVVEFAFDFYQTASGLPTSCQDFMTNTGSVAEISYVIQMSDRAQTNPRYLQKAGTTYVTGGVVP